MPFTRYLQEPQPPPYYTHHADDADHHPPFSHAVEFQLPQFIYSSAPTLAPGGGAEVLPYASSWFTNTGFNQSTSLNPLPQPSTSSLQAPMPAKSPAIPPPPRGLPIYSASGFDLLSILARVHSRPSPHITLGPVDLTCSFVVVDVRRHDAPIVYCSPSFCRLTGYPEHEVLGRNCRFLQAPGGHVPRGALRSDTAHPSVAHLRKALAADKECQASLMNYRKDGSAFLNLVSVIPIAGGVAGEAPDDVVFHVGFQVDLTEQPNIILQKLRDGTYAVDYNPGPRAPKVLPALPPVLSGKKASAVSTALIPAPKMSRTLEALLASPRFLASLPFATSTNVPQPRDSSSTSTKDTPGNHPLSLLLLNHAPDFMHVVSLKGTFLYVAPAVRRVLGYDPAELVGRSLADLAHPEDVIPLERELKESSAVSYGAAAAAASGVAAGSTGEEGGNISVATGPRLPSAPRMVDMLFRARTKEGRYVWLECRGRLHVEPGKGRKAIMLSGRARAMGRVGWGEMVAGAHTPAPAPTQGHTHPQEFWALVSGGRALLAAGPGVERVLGWAPDELVGRRVAWLVDEFGLNPNPGGTPVAGGPAEAVEEILRELDAEVASTTGASPSPGGGNGGAAQGQAGDAAEREVGRRVVRCWLRRRGGGRVKVEMTVLRPGVDGEPAGAGAPNPCEGGASAAPAGALPRGVSPPPLVVHVRVLALVEAEGQAEGAAGAGRWTPGVGFSPESGQRGHGHQPQPQTQAQPHPQPQAQPQPQAPIYPPTANVFEELEIGRASSWQYELQQLRFANLRLVGEIAALEAGHSGADPMGMGTGTGMGEDAGVGGQAQQQQRERTHEGDGEKALRRRRKSAVVGLDGGEGANAHGEGQGQLEVQGRGYAPSAFSSSTLADALRPHTAAQHRPPAQSQSRQNYQRSQQQGPQQQQQQPYSYPQHQHQNQQQEHVQNLTRTQSLARGHPRDSAQAQAQQPLLTSQPLHVVPSHAPPHPQHQNQHQPQHQPQHQTQHQHQHQNQNQPQPLHTPTPRATRRLAQAMLHAPGLGLGYSPGASSGSSSGSGASSRMGMHFSLGGVNMANMHMNMGANMGAGTGMERPVSVAVAHPYPHPHPQAHALRPQSGLGMGMGLGLGLDRSPSVPAPVSASAFRMGAREEARLPVYAPTPRAAAAVPLPVAMSEEDQRRLMAMEGEAGHGSGPGMDLDLGLGLDMGMGMDLGMEMGMGMGQEMGVDMDMVVRGWGTPGVDAGLGFTRGVKRGWGAR